MPVCVERASELPEAIRRASAIADVIEFRLDYLAEKEREQALAILKAWLDSSDPPVILTFRPAEQGGHNSSDLDSRRRFWSSLMSLSDRALFDLELDLVLDLVARRQTDEPSIDWSRVICSHHDFTGIQADLDELYQSMAATPARILKIAVQANDATDCVPIFRLLERAQNDGRALIAIAMGQEGIMTRILGPARGSFLTYGALDDKSANAPGQVSAKKLKEVYRIDKLNQETGVFGVIGSPVGHSLSPQIHNAAFGTAGVNAVYIPFEVRDADQFMRRMVCPRSRELDWGLRGLSVTAPHKAVVMKFLDWIEPIAESIGAVNTILIRGDDMRGYNTDAAGFLAPLRQKFGS
ncbi:MAG TPA: type I 3-dehydroquinate dehydratase, partial [Pyrinomonadaceae bacterium]|nr:type I 3-dehydroquinate dehydratase [Pyrinomonadaceae bacterium]